MLFNSKPRRTTSRVALAPPSSPQANGPAPTLWSLRSEALIQQLDKHAQSTSDEIKKAREALQSRAIAMAKLEQELESVKGDMIGWQSSGSTLKQLVQKLTGDKLRETVVFGLHSSVHVLGLETKSLANDYEYVSGLLDSDRKAYADELKTWHETMPAAINADPTWFITVTEHQLQKEFKECRQDQMWWQDIHDRRVRQVRVQASLAFSLTRSCR